MKKISMSAGQHREVMVRKPSAFRGTVFESASIGVAEGTSPAASSSNASGTILEGGNGAYDASTTVLIVGTGVLVVRAAMLGKCFLSSNAALVVRNSLTDASLSE